MDKIDLIIDALEKAINACRLYDRQDIQDGGTVYLAEELEASINALAAARELRAMKPIGEIVCDDLCKPLHARKIRMHFYDFAPLSGTKLYALDEVKHD